jgi:hypothetical protein
MKVNHKFRQISRPQEYIQLANSLFNLSRKLKTIVPYSVDLETTISSDMIDISVNGKPPFFAGSSCSGDLQTDQHFAESMGLDLHNYLKFR